MLFTTWADVFAYYVYCYLADVIAICLWQMLTTYTTLGLMLLHTVLSMLTDVFVNYIEDIYKRNVDFSSCLVFIRKTQFLFNRTNF